jgi:hypothetical protein
MATKKMHDASTLCTCNLCGLKERSIPGTRHRRCGGSKDAPKRAKHSHTGRRGTWA